MDECILSDFINKTSPAGNDTGACVKYGIAGLGLIGGSLAMAFKKCGFYVAGYDTNPQTVEASLLWCRKTNPQNCLFMCSTPTIYYCPLSRGYH